jgi:hypothetical protein
MFLRRLLFVSVVAAPAWCCCVLPLPRRSEAQVPEIPYVVPHAELTIPAQ